MSAENEITAPAELARFEFVSPEFASPWQTPLPIGRVRRWLAWLAAAWREGMELYARAAMVRGRTHWWP